MKYKRMGKTGLVISRIGLGMMSYGSSSWRDWVLDKTDASPIIKKALDEGVNFFDTADFYSMGESERVTGNILNSYAKREDIVVATKVYTAMSDKPNRGGLSRKHIMQSIDASLTRLNMDYVDLYQIHRWDYETPIEETMEALNDLVRIGKVRYLGASTMYAWQFAKAQYTAKLNGLTPFVSMQNHYNLIYREEEREMLPLCKELGVGIIPWSPLARGFLAGKNAASDEAESKRSKSDAYKKSLYGSENDYSIYRILVELAKQRNVSTAQISLAWLLSKPEVTAPVIGATKLHYLDSALEALEIELSSEEIQRLEEAYTPHEVLTFGMHGEFNKVTPT
jgi:1-deoxyxylulose-5-phosphate synthase